MAVLIAVDKWRHYLEGDNSSLGQTMKALNSSCSRGYTQIFKRRDDKVDGIGVCDPIPEREGEKGS